MSRQSARMSATESGGLPAVMCASVKYCQGCCCGTLAKHPGVDQDALRERLRDGLSQHAIVRAVDCLDICDDSNVVVVSPSALARSRGARPVWLRQMLTPALMDAVVEWVQAGGPGTAELPATLKHHTRRRRP